MFQSIYNKDTQTLSLKGNLDASRIEVVKNTLEKIEGSVTVDMSGLNFICSAGIGIIVMTYRRLKENGENIYLANLNDHIKKVFKVSLLDKIFNIQ
jgi:anti-sigma B factor antagonist